MKWPWVARSLHDEVRADRDRLRAQCDGLVDHLKRVERAERGLPEVPSDRKVVEPMPDDVRSLINAWGPNARVTMERDAWAVYARTRDWNKVREAIKPEETVQ